MDSIMDWEKSLNNICHPKINHCTLPCTFVIECIYWCLTICLQLQCMTYMMCIAVDITQLPGNHCTLLPRYTMPPTTALEENKIFTWHLMVYFSPILSIHSEIQWNSEKRKVMELVHSSYSWCLTFKYTNMVNINSFQYNCFSLLLKSWTYIMFYILICISWHRESYKFWNNFNINCKKNALIP